MYDLVLDAGHGGNDPGALKGTRLEKDWTLRITEYQLKRFKELGVSVIVTRGSDKTLTNDERVRIAKQGRYCISNHLNAGGGDRGEVIHSIYTNGQLANGIKEALLHAGQSSVKVYFRKGNNGDYYYMHRLTGATVTTIVEYCFLDNEADFKHFEANWEEYAEAVVRAFCSHISKPYSPPKRKTVNSNTFYRVVTGSFSDKKNAEDRVKELKSKGFESFIDVYKK